MKTKSKIIFGSLLVIALCISLIAGTTFALFTSEDKVDVVVKSAKVDVSADIANGDNDITYGYNGTSGLNESLSAVYSNTNAGKVLTISNMTPGDVVMFKVVIKSNATVNVKYRLKFGCTDENADDTLYGQLLLGVKDSADAEYDYYVDCTSDWSQIVYSENAADMQVVKYVAIELPAYVTNAWQEATCNIQFAVEAVQANASEGQYGESGSAVKAYRVSSDAELDQVIGALADDATAAIVLDSASGDYSIETDKALVLTVRGGNVGTLTVNAPNAEIDYRVDKTAIVDVNAVKGQSLHIFGAIDELTVKSGRAVIEEGAQVEKAVAAPTADQIAIIVANANLAVLETAGEGKVEVTVPADVTIGSAVLNNSNEETVIINDGNIEQAEGENIAISTKITNAEELAKAVALGGEVTLSNDILLEQTLRISGKVALNLAGNTLTFTPVADVYTRPFVINAGASLTVNGEEDGSQVLVTVGTVYGVFDIFGELNVYGGHYEAADGAGGSVVRGRADSKTHIYAGEFVSQGYGAALYDEGDCIVEDGYFYTNSSNRTSNWSYCFQNVAGTMHVKNATVVGIQGGIAAVGGETIIDDCTVNVRDPFKTSESDNRSWYALYVNGNHAEATCRVNGGEFTSEYRYAVYIGNPTPGDGGEQRYSMAEIYGGTFIAGPLGAGCVLVSDPNGNGYIPGGTYISHVKTAAQLKQALAANLPNYTIVLDSDIELTTSIGLTDSQSLALDLNGHVLTVGGSLVTSGAPIFAKGTSSLTIINGTLTPKNFRWTQSMIDMYDIANVVVKNVIIERSNNYPTYCYGITAHGSGTITVDDCTIKAGCAVSTNASEDITPTITINDSKLEGYATGLLFNVNGTLNVTNTDIVGINQGVFMRAGNATFTDSTIRTTLIDPVTNDLIVITKDSADKTFNPYYLAPNPDNWKTGTQNIPLAALVIGCSKAESSYWQHAYVTLVNTTVDESEEFLATKSEDVGMIHHAILAWNAHGEDVGSATVTMDDASKGLLKGTICTVVGMDYTKAVIE